MQFKNVLKNDINHCFVPLCINNTCISYLHVCEKYLVHAEKNHITLSGLCAEKHFKRSTSMLNCDSPEDLPHFSDM